MASHDHRKGELEQLASHILGTHHVFARAEIPRLRSLVQRALHEQPAHRVELGCVDKLLGELADDLLPHMDREEKRLFPYVVALEAATRGNPLPIAPFGSVRHPIRTMTDAHDRTTLVLRSLRLATDAYAPPAGAPALVHDLYDGLAALDHDLAEHVRIEDEVLFPKARALEEKLFGVHLEL